MKNEKLMEDVMAEITKTERESVGEIIGFTQAAKILGCSRVTVWRMAQDGQLEAFKVRDAWRTSVPACEKYIRKHYGEQAYECRMKNKR